MCDTPSVANDADVRSALLPSLVLRGSGAVGVHGGGDAQQSDEP
jgi:hypothetical protein